jgi:hypothetical protein
MDMKLDIHSYRSCCGEQIGFVLSGWAGRMRHVTRCWEREWKDRLMLLCARVTM